MGVNFNQLCSNVLPVGTYKVQITDIKFKTSGTGVTSNDMVVTYQVVDGPHVKKTIKDTIYEKAFSFRLKPFLQAVGVDTAREFNTTQELYAYGIKEAKGKILMIDVTVRKYNGSDYNDIKSFKPLPGSTTTTNEVLDAFDSFGIEPDKPYATDINPVSVGNDIELDITEDTNLVNTSELDTSDIF